MQRTNATLSLAAFWLVSLIFAFPTFAQQPPDNVEGNWTIYSTRIQDGAIETKHVQIAQYGNRITGYFEGPVQSGPIQGDVDVHHIRFSTVTSNVLTFRGQIYGNNMSGTYGLHGKHAPWQAMRTSGGPVEVEPAVSYSQPVLTPPAPAAPGYMPTPVTVPQTATYSATTSAPQSNPAPIPAALSSDQLDALVAPIALYPDALVAQVLAASTNPDQVAYADDWLAQNRNLTGTALEQATDQQSWDPSVKALTQFPSVLDNLAHNLSWTSSLGQAFANQQSDVMMAVQVMRAKAQAAGTLQSNSQITVTQPAANTIVIQPANPQIVYVPQYNPTIVYGAPVVVPMYVAPPLPVASVGLYFGTGITIGAAFGGGGWGGGFGWGWHAWNVNWGGWGGGGGSTIIFNHNTYINNHTWNNTNYNGYHPWGGGAAGSQNHAWYGANGTFHPDGNYKPGEDTHYGPNGGYHPNGYFGPDGGWHADKGTGANTPNGGNNGNHGLIGGNGGVQNRNAGMNGPGVAPPGGYHNDGHQGGTYLGASNDRSNARNLGSSRMSGDGTRSRMESNRGRESMAGRRPQQHMAREHAPAEHHSGGGGGRRR
ncbi:MAG TPA: DUF3300 domain-containing protein [Candidatus Sulfotelmatobacter sp.]|nr:DUF3300 domain-containing protein [Candidatus Sulfotelmatobacter sp.]